MERRCRKNFQRENYFFLRVHILKDYFYFYKEEEGKNSSPYKFIIKLNNEADFTNFTNRSEKRVIKDDEKKLKEKNDDRSPQYNILDFTYEDKVDEFTYADIIVNFLKIVSHLKYNYEYLRQHYPTNVRSVVDSLALASHTDIFSSTSVSGGTGEFTFNGYLNDRIHKFHNMKLLYLITDHTPSPSSQEFIDDIRLIKDTFKNTIDKPTFDATGTRFYNYYMKLKFICNLLVVFNNESGEENINFNHLKNVIKTTYKQINEEDIKFKNRSKYIDDYNAENKYEISPITNYSTKSNSIKNITNNANYFTGHGILFNYFANAVLILVIYNLGYN